MQGIFDVVGRAAVKRTVLTGELVNLCQSTFHKTCSAADKGDNPHPKDGAGAAGNDGNGYTGDIADADTGGCADTKCLKGAYGMTLGFCADIRGYEPQHFRQKAQLHKTGGQGKVNARTYEDDNQHV